MPDVMGRLGRIASIFLPQGNQIETGPSLDTNMPGFPNAMNIGGPPSNIGMEGRMQGQFEPSMDIPQQVSQMPQIPRGNRLDELYSPQTYFQDEYKRLLSEIPERNKPGIWRKIGASIVGAGGHDPMRFLYAPYMKELEDWNLRREALEPGLNAERYQNVNERQIASSILQSEDADRRLDIATSAEERKRKEGEEKLRQGDEKIKIQKHRADTYRYRTENPNNILTEDDQGNLMAFNPQTKKIEYLLDDEGQPIKGSSMSEFDKIKLQIKGRKEVIAAQTEADLREEATRHANDLREIAARGAESRKTKTTSPDEGNVQTTTATTQVKDKEGNVTGTRTQTTQKTTQKGSNTGVKMKTPDGRVVLVPKDKVEEAKKKGGKVVP